MSDTDDRREHTRYPLRAFAELGDSTHEWAAHVSDISYQGARVALLDNHDLEVRDNIRLRIEIPEVKVPKDMEPYLHLKGTLVHQQGNMLGVRYEPESEMDAELLKLLIENFA